MRVTVVYPQSDDARAELARRVAAAHAERITRSIQHLSCSADQKQRLLSATIHKIADREL